jgi:alpha-L-fucosidase 2
MKNSYLLLLLISTVAAAQKPATKDALTLWYKQPATEWTEALPLGNGRLGAMVFGRPGDELLQLNEATLWSGGPVQGNINPDAPKYLPLVRKALFAGDYHAADSLLHFMQGNYSQSYLPLGDLHIRQQLPDTAVSEYYRDLNISDALATTRFTSGGVQYTRDAFISAPDQVIVLRFGASKAGALNFTISPTSQLRAQRSANGQQVSISGKAPSQVYPSYVQHDQPVQYEAGGCKGMRFELRLQVAHTDGKVTIDSTGITISNASEAVILATAATSFNGYDKCPDSEGLDEKALVSGYLQKALKHSYQDLWQRHEEDYHHFFNRVSFKLGDDVNNNPTDERLRAYSSGASDPGLETLYFQFGRYLLISSSRTPGVPANLQGIWNKELRAPWSSNYTININTEMNYWPAEVCNLAEMEMPLIQLIKEISITGHATAWEFYHARGWVAHHNSDIWAMSNPVGDKGHGDPMWANWTMGGNWLCQFLWKRYQYSNDRAFLQDTAYPIMHDAARFCLDWLIPDGKGHLVTAPATSPENRFVTAAGKHEAVTIATTMDRAIISELFRNTIAASKVLGKDTRFADSLQHALALLPPYKVGKRGNLMEWPEDWGDDDPEHRHISHLYPLFPGDEITPATPSLAAAAKRALEIRGDGGTGWSKAWKINTWARLQDGDHAYKLLRELLTYTAAGGVNMHNGGGTYANLFCAHPPFQIDGNFGGTSGIAQMLLQNRADTIEVLPAIPSAWSNGEVKGLKGIGGYTLDVSWKNGVVTALSVQAIRNGYCYLRFTKPVSGLAKYAVGENLYRIQMKAGKPFTNN